MLFLTSLSQMVHFFSGRGRTIWNLLTVLALVWDTRPFWSQCWWCSCTESRREAEPITKFQACHHHTHVVLDIGENEKLAFGPPSFSYAGSELMRFGTSLLSVAVSSFFIWSLLILCFVCCQWQIDVFIWSLIEDIIVIPMEFFDLPNLVLLSVAEWVTIFFWSVDIAPPGAEKHGDGLVLVVPNINGCVWK